MEPLIIKVDQIDAPRQPWHRALGAAFLADVLADAPAQVWKANGEARFTAHLTKLGERDVLLEGKAILALESACRRCLKPVASDVPVVFLLNFVARPKVQKGRRRNDDDDSGEGDQSASFEEDEVDRELFDGESIDLAPVLREQLILGLPSIEPLCRDTCKGLCTSCGQDLNEADCGHAQTAPDPRWSALKGIKL